MLCLSTRDSRFKRPRQPSPISSAPLIGGVAAVESALDQEDRRVLVENDFFRVTIIRKGGKVRIRSKAGWVHNMNLDETVGPGFFPSEFDRKDFDLTFTQSGSMATVMTTIVSENFPRLELQREITITASPVIQVGYRLRHTGNPGAESYVYLSHYDLQPPAQSGRNQWTLDHPAQNWRISGAASVQHAGCGRSHTGHAAAIG